MRILVFVFVLFAALHVGAEEATYLFSDGDVPVPTAANGYVQEVRELADGTHEAQWAVLTDAQKKWVYDNAPADIEAILKGLGGSNA